MAVLLDRRNGIRQPAQEPVSWLARGQELGCVVPPVGPTGLRGENACFDTLSTEFSVLRYPVVASFRMLNAAMGYAPFRDQNRKFSTGACLPRVDNTNRCCEISVSAEGLHLVPVLPLLDLSKALFERYSGPADGYPVTVTANNNLQHHHSCKILILGYAGMR